MTGSSSPSGLTSDRVGAMAAELLREKAALEDQRSELGLLIKQATAEAERAAQRARDAAAQVAQVEANLEAFPRSEIRRRYAEVLESQMRLATWRSQLEQLRSRQPAIDKMVALVDRALAVQELMLSQAARRWVGEPAVGAALPADPSAAEIALQSIELANHRLSRRLQESTAQTLSDLVLRAEVCERLVEVDPGRAREEMGALKAATGAALRATRQFIQELVPPALEELGIVAALRRHLEASWAGQRLQVSLEVIGDERRLPPKVEMALFRIVQEALSNAARHSGTSEVEVKLRFDAGQVVATVADRGRGFDVEPALVRGRWKGRSGLIDMQLRAELAGGTLEIGSKAGAGCIASAAIPV